MKRVILADSLTTEIRLTTIESHLFVGQRDPGMTSVREIRSLYGRPNRNVHKIEAMIDYTVRATVAITEIGRVIRTDQVRLNTEKLASFCFL